MQPIESSAAGFNASSDLSGGNEGEGHGGPDQKGGHEPARRSATGPELRNAMKTVFTTGEAAEICKVSQQTIIRCFDSGRLKGFRVPGSRFRRIPRDALIAFMKDNNIPPDALDSGKQKILVVDDDPEIVELFVDVLERDGRFEVKTASSGFEAGMQAKEY